MKWFKHDSNANGDAKLKRVRIKYGMEGYGLYWYLLELIAAGIERHNLTFELEHDAELIAHDTGIHYERIHEMMNYFIDLELFESSQGIITCLKMAARTDEYISKSLRTLSGQTTDTAQTKALLIENKRKEENKKKNFIPPTLQEVTDYCKERINNVVPQQFIDHYQANGWMRGKAKIKDWKACVHTWEKNSTAQHNQYVGFK